MGYVRTDDADDGIRVLTLCKPDRLNAIDFDGVRELHDALEAIARDRTCRVVIMTGEGRGFCAGLDLKAFGGFGASPGDRVWQGMTFQELIAGLIPRMRSLPQPIIAAVNGPATGGGLGFRAESLHLRRGGEIPGADHFERHRSVQGDLAGEINDSHSARRDLALQFVIAEIVHFAERTGVSGFGFSAPLRCATGRRLTGKHRQQTLRALSGWCVFRQRGPAFGTRSRSCHDVLKPSNG